MQHSRPTFHLFSDRLANEKKRLEAQLAELQPGPERDQLLQKLRQLDTASHINEWLSSPGCNSRERSEAMADYRAYIVGEDGHFLDCEARTWRDDRQAVEWAKQLVDGRTIELWSGKRFVTKLEPKPEIAARETN